MKLANSYHHQRPTTSGLPLIDQIELTNLCNLKCPMCPQPHDMTRPKNYMNLDLFKEIIEQIKFFQMPSTGLHHFGEVLLHKEFEKILQLIPNHPFSKIGFSTNAALLNEEKCRLILNSNIKWILMDFDTFDEELFEKYRPGTQMKTVHDNIVRFLSMKEKMGSSIEATVQMITMKSNENEVDKFKQYWLEKGATKVNIQKFIVHDARLEDKYDNFTPEDKTNQLQRIGTCKYPWLNVVITWDGKIVPCCRDYNASIVLGDIGENTLQEIWQSSIYTDFRKAHIDKIFDDYEACKNCGSFLSMPIDSMYPFGTFLSKIK